MTKREFDALTKVNHCAGLFTRDNDWRPPPAPGQHRPGRGFHMGARTQYRRDRGHVDARDYVGERAAELARRNWAPPGCQPRDGFLPTLSIGSRFRAPQAHRARTGASLLRLG